MAATAEVAVLVEDLVKTYKGDVRALDGVSFQVPEATVLGLLGPNGAGKTTAVRVLSTLLKPDSGRAVVAGVDVLADPEAARRVIGLAGQYAAVDEALTGEENLVLVGRLNHLPVAECRERARVLLERFELADAARRTLKTYSGGMRRRLDLAAALVARPPVLFLDEPTTGLDPQSRRQLWDVILDLRARGRTTVLTTHYMDEAERLCDRVAIVDKGKVIALGSPADLIARTGAEHVVEFAIAGGEAAQARLEPAGLDHLASVLASRTEGDGFALTVAEPHQAIPSLLEFLKSAGHPLARLTTRQVSLEDVFVAMTGRHLREDGVEDPEAPPPKRGRRRR